MREMENFVTELKQEKLNFGNFMQQLKKITDGVSFKVAFYEDEMVVEYGEALPIDIIYRIGKPIVCGNFTDIEAHTVGECVYGEDIKTTAQIIELIERSIPAINNFLKEE